jgi:hypothetical protein
MGELKKLIIESYDNINRTGTVSDEYKFVAMFNPENYTKNYKITYTEPKTSGGTGGVNKFTNVQPQKYTFDFLIDGTGVSSGSLIAMPFVSATVKDVQKEIDKFLKIAGKLDGSIHRPRYLIITWGSLLIRCVLIDAAISYTLFDPDGKPLRAKIKATFTEDDSEYLIESAANKTSPDLTHVRTVNEGDTLPIMTFKIYGDARYYIKVAQFNNLNNFRNLKVGDQVYFPSLPKLLAQ